LERAFNVGDRMKYGYIYEKDIKEIEKDIKKGESLYEGIYLVSLLSFIDILDIKHNRDSNKVLSELKKEILIASGKIEEKSKNEKSKK